jgi:hypothetical protein
MDRKIVEALEKINSTLWWIALWLFLIWFL